MNLKNNFLLLLFVLCFDFLTAQTNRWQQQANYTMSIDMDVQTNRFSGKQRIEYFNNSPDKLNRLFYHLYFNAFQPGSSMDVRSRELGKTLINNRPDWDTRVKDRSSKLTDAEIGYQKIKSLKVNGIAQPFQYHETILEVNLRRAILPKLKVIIDL